MLLPGGFGTLDEAFELLTLLQTGKAQPAPIVLLDVPGGTYWQHWLEFVAARARAARATSRPRTTTCSASPTTSRPRSTRSSASTATTTRCGSSTGRLVLRMQHAPSTRAARGAERGVRRHRRARARSRSIDATPDEIADDDHVDLARIALPLRPPRLVAAAHAHRPRSTTGPTVSEPAMSQVTYDFAGRRRARSPAPVPASDAASALAFARAGADRRRRRRRSRPVERETVELAGRRAPRFVPRRRGVERRRCSGMVADRDRRSSAGSTTRDNNAGVAAGASTTSATFPRPSGTACRA